MSQITIWYFLCSFYNLLAPCSPEILNISKDTLSIISVHWHARSDGAMYTVTVKGEPGKWYCTSSGNSCSIHNLPCGSLFFINAVASTEAGYSLPSYSVPLETGKESIAIIQLKSPVCSMHTYYKNHPPLCFKQHKLVCKPTL